MRSLKHEEGEELLAIARKALYERMFCETAQAVSPPVHPILLESAGAFVTLKKHRSLRGCIGRLFPEEPLFRVVSDCAISAALHDPRFDPVTADELDLLHIDVSVLGEMVTIQSDAEIQVGKHGLFIRKEGLQGLLLPQVAVEMRLDRFGFLELTCRKAGLPRNAWKENAVIQVFTADIFCSDPNECHASA